MATQSSTLAWQIPWTEEPDRLQSMGLLRVRHRATSLSLSLSCIGKGNGNPLQYFCLENPRDRGAYLTAAATAYISMASLVTQQIKNLSAMKTTQETRILSLGWEDPLEEEMATHSSTLKWKIPRIEDPGGLQSIGSQRIRRDRATKHTCTHKHGVENGSSRQYSCLENSMDRGV